MLFLFLNNQTDLVITLPSLALLMSSLLYLTVGCGLTILGIHHPLLHLKPKIWKTGKKKEKKEKQLFYSTFVSGQEAPNPALCKSTHNSKNWFKWQQVESDDCQKPMHTFNELQLYKRWIELNTSIWVVRLDLNMTQLVQYCNFPELSYQEISHAFSILWTVNKRGTYSSPTQRWTSLTV